MTTVEAYEHPKGTCRRCGFRPTWDEQKRVYGRLSRAGWDTDLIKRNTPLCSKCATERMREAKVPRPVCKHCGGPLRTLDEQKLAYKTLLARKQWARREANAMTPICLDCALEKSQSNSLK